jgi:polyferredoxin
MAGIGLFLVTSAVGRAWCGYACPQTVWTDLFQHVERAVDGDRNAQIGSRTRRGDRQDFQAPAEMVDLAFDRVRHRRRLDLLFRRCADA